MQRSANSILPIVLASFVAAACSEGGDTTNATSEVKLQVDHHMASLGGSVQFKEGFPLTENEFYTDAATLHFKDDGKYFLTRPGRAKSSDEDYFLRKNGDLTITISQQGRSALRWPGYYDLDGDGYFFVSRASGFLRLFIGVRQIEGTPVLEGNWWVFGDTLVFADENAKVSHEHVGRAFNGSITFDKDGKVTDGSWKNSAGGTVLVSGKADTATLGAVDLSLALTNGFTPGRTFSGGVAKHVGVLIDRVTTGSKNDEKNVGAFVMVRESDSSADIKRLAGVWRVGVHAIFNTPRRSGVDVATGELQVLNDKTWELTLGNVKRSGRLGLGTKGELVLTETGLNQAWNGAVDPDHTTLVFVDRTIERSSNPWVALYYCVKLEEPQ